jgi:hypothetical protein
MTAIATGDAALVSFALDVLGAWCDGDWDALDADDMETIARTHGLIEDVPSGVHEDCEHCEDGVHTCAQLPDWLRERLP